MFITVVGGGNSTAIFACLAKTAGHSVAILTRRPNDWSKTVGFRNDDKGYLEGAPNMEAEMDVITADPAECIPQSDMIFIAGLPIHHNTAVLKSIRPHMDMSKKTFVGTICAYGGFDWVTANALGAGEYVSFGTQLIPWCCGTVEYGKTGLVIGAKRLLRIATAGGKDEHGVKDVLKGILRMPFLTDTDFIASSMWPNNSSLHPPILYGLFKDWDGKAAFDPATLPTAIYADLRTESAKAMVALDNELVALVGALSKAHPDNEFLADDFSLKKCVMENYEDQITNTWDTVTSIMTNKAFAVHCIPYTQVDGGVVPTLKHKFFETDLPYGLVMFKDIALMAKIDVPMIDALIKWNQRLIEKSFLMDDGTLTGADIGEAMVPSRLGLTLATICTDGRALASEEAKDAKA